VGRECRLRQKTTATRLKTTKPIKIEKEKTERARETPLDGEEKHQRSNRRQTLFDTFTPGTAEAARGIKIQFVDEISVLIFTFLPHRSLSMSRWLVVAMKFNTFFSSRFSPSILRQYPTLTSETFLNYDFVELKDKKKSPTKISIMSALGLKCAGRVKKYWAKSPSSSFYFWESFAQKEVED
jgi:hypothetical protein